MPALKLKQFLDAHHIQYTPIPHYAAFTAQEIAAAAHVRGREMVKTVMVKLDGELAMTVLPATKKLDLEAIKEVSGAAIVDLASEREFKDRFPDCEIGAMPPFGNLYGMPVYVDRMLLKDDQIAFNAGTHEELIQMAYSDFDLLVRPVVADLSYRPRQPV